MIVMALQLMGIGLLGVFTALAVLFVSIRLMTLKRKDKKDTDENEQN